MNKQKNPQTKPNTKQPTNTQTSHLTVVCFVVDCYILLYVIFCYMLSRVLKLLFFGNGTCILELQLP